MLNFLTRKNIDNAENVVQENTLDGNSVKVGIYLTIAMISTIFGVVGIFSSLNMQNKYNGVKDDLNKTNLKLKELETTNLHKDELLKDIRNELKENTELIRKIKTKTNLIIKHYDKKESQKDPNYIEIETMGFNLFNGQFLLFQQDNSKLENDSNYLFSPNKHRKNNHLNKYYYDDNLLHKELRNDSL